MRSDLFRVLFSAGLIGLLVLIGVGVRALMTPPEPVMMVGAAASHARDTVESQQPPLIEVAAPPVFTTATPSLGASVAPSASVEIRTSQGPKAHRDSERALLDERIKKARFDHDRAEVARLMRLRSDLDRNVPFPTASSSAP